MADIKKKPINDLSTWNSKELRKLKITINNRISAFETTQTPKELPANHPLFKKETEELKEMLQKVIKTEKDLSL